MQDLPLTVLMLAPLAVVWLGVALLYLLDSRPVDARRRTGRADRRIW